MATRALATASVAGRRAAGQGQGALAVLSSSGSCCACRRGGAAAQSFSHSTAEREREGHADATAAQVEAALNLKNVDVVQGEDRSATLLAADAAQALRGVGDGDAEDAWVPDQETGVFVPADEASGSGDGDGADGGGGLARGQGQQAAPSVLDQAVFVREEDMEDVERPAVGNVPDAGAAAE